MKKTTLLFAIAASGAVALSLYNKSRNNSKLTLASSLCSATANQLARSLQKAILVKGAVSLAAVTLAGVVCKKLTPGA